MSTFTERELHFVEVVPPFSILQCRTVVIVEKDGVEIGRSNRRHVRAPGADMTNECEEMKAVAAALWTPEIIAAYKNHVEQQALSGPGNVNS